VRESEHILLSHLTETASLEVLAAEGFGTDEGCEVLSADVSREIVQWALEVYFSSGRITPITKLMIEETWGDDLERLSIIIDDEHELEPIEWAIDDLRATHASKLTHDFATRLSIAVAEEASAPDRVQVLIDHSNELFRLTRSLVSRRQQMDAGQGLEMALAAYYQRVEANAHLEGLAFGLPSVDNYTKGIHLGEVAVFAAPTGVGKSWVGLRATFEEWRRRRKTVMFTLENSLPMTFDRLACVGAGVRYEAWQEGSCNEQEILRVKKLLEEMLSTTWCPLIVQPDRGERTMTAMVRKTFTENAVSLIIDQLSFVEETTKGAKAKNRWAAFGDMMHELHDEIADGKEKLSALVLHQIKREGIESAAKSGKFAMSDLAESSEIERTADFVFSVYRSDFDIQNDLATWQTLKVRRVPPGREFDMVWDLSRGHIAVKGDVATDRVIS
jgi:replicative DNA helicase